MHPRISCTNFCSSLALLLSRDETVKRIEKYELLKAWITEHIIHTNTHQSYISPMDGILRVYSPIPANMLAERVGTKTESHGLET